MRSTLARWLMPAHAALCALALILTACATTGEAPRFGSVVQPNAQVRQGSSGSRTLLDAVVATASVSSSELECSGFSDAWVEFLLAGFDASTDLVGTLQVYGGNSPLIADQQALPIDQTKTLPVGATDYPTGISVDSTVDYGIDIAADFAGPSLLIAVPLRGIPRYLTAKYTRTSGGTGATITSTAYCR